MTVQVERTLGPQRYHARLPWFAEVLGDGRVRIDGGRQEVMDREIGFAAQAGLDYWSFLLYPEASPMSQSLRLYLTSAARRPIGFCVILHNSFKVNDAQWPSECQRTADLLREPGYQTVLGGRPRVFAFQTREDRIAEFRQAAKAAGVDPYCMLMGWNPSGDFQRASPLGFAAVSGLKRRRRGTHGRGKLTRDFQTLPEEYLLVLNLENETYLQLVLGGSLEWLPAKLAEASRDAGSFDAWRRQRCPRLLGELPRRLLREEDFIDHLIEACVHDCQSSAPRAA